MGDGLTAESQEALMRLEVDQHVNDGAAVKRAVLTLILVLRALHGARSDLGGRRRPPFEIPARILNFWCVVGAGDFAVDGPIEACWGGGMHGRLLRFGEERASVFGKRVRLRKVR